MHLAKRFLPLPIMALLASFLAWILIVRAATPASQSTTVPTAAGQTVTVTWTGTIPAGANPTSSCSGVPDATRDKHSVTINVPAGTYGNLLVSAKFSIKWASANTDGILSIERAGTNVGDTDSSGVEETITAQNPAAGTYDVFACAFTAPTATPYTGTLTLTATSAAAAAALPSADPQGLEFSSSVMADIQRDESEPLIEIDPDGVIYTCGPTGTSQAAEYAQVSTDGGDSFHLLGAPPRGQFSQGGGGDCALATGTAKNTQGKYTLGYAGLSGLVNFTTATSPDNGHTLTASPTSQSVPGVDRQWMVFSDDKTVFLNFNAQQPRNVTVQKSTDGGLTYGTPISVSPNPSFPGPMRSMPAALNPKKNGMPVVYYPWTAGTNVNMAVSMDNGTTWGNCLALPAKGDPSQSFPVADNDVEGNIYLGYVDDANFGAYVGYAPNAELLKCTGSIAVTPPATQPALTAKMGFGPQIQANRGEIVSTIFPWLVAGGAKGRVAMTFIGSKTPGSPGDLSLFHTWHIYVSQSLNMDTPTPAFAQVQATSHPMYYDQICLDGLGCTLNSGDRSLGDFYSIDLNPKNGELVIVFNLTHKGPRGAVGQVASPLVIRQIAGPSNLGGMVANNGRKVIRESSDDPTGDALAKYSNLYVTPATVNIPAADIKNVTVGTALDLTTGLPLAGGGFTVTMSMADLSAAALQSALTAVPAQSLVWIFRFQGGYKQSAVSARWNAAQGFTYGFNNYEGTATDCLAPANPEAAGQDGCVYYTGGTAVQGKVDQAKGIIQLTVPLALLKALDGPGSRGVYPVEKAAVAGDRMFAAAVYSQANTTSPSQTAQGYMIPLDNSPAMDFLIPGKATTGTPNPTPTPTPTPVGTIGGATPPATTTTHSDGGRFGGGALGGLALLPLTLVALFRRRKLH